MNDLLNESTIDSGNDWLKFIPEMIGTDNMVDIGNILLSELRQRIKKDGNLEDEYYYPILEELLEDNSRTFFIFIFFVS